MYHPRCTWETKWSVNFWVGVSENVNERWLGWTPPVSTIWFVSSVLLLVLVLLCFLFGLSSCSFYLFLLLLLLLLLLLSFSLFLFCPVPFPTPFIFPFPFPFPVHCPFPFLFRSPFPVPFPFRLSPTLRAWRCCLSVWLDTFCNDRVRRFFCCLAFAILLWSRMSYRIVLTRMISRRSSRAGELP